MNEQEQIRAIAELDGYFTCDDPNHDCGYPQNYLTSRDAIVPVIEKQPDEIKENVCDCLDLSTKHIITALATPTELCEALLKSCGKWKE